MLERARNDEEWRADESPALAALLAAGIDPRDRLAKTIDALSWTTMDATQALMLEAHFKSLKERCETRATWLRAQITLQMAQLDITKYSGKLATARIQAAPQKLVVTDEQQIPASYFKAQMPVLDRAELKDDLKQGVVVDGAHLSNGAPMLVVRRK